MEIVIDLSKIGVIVVREIDDSDETDGSDFRDGEDYWFKTPYGDVLYARGLDQLRLLLGMVREINQQLIGNWIYWMTRIFELKTENSKFKHLEFELSYDGKVTAFFPEMEGREGFDDLSYLLTYLLDYGLSQSREL
ncbi:hypothetical protein [Brucella pituitosa]|uniref:Uncharacterized protein n=1 Tax=Brucella pituitosa TaxID=571256 RepID=A0ABS3K183_9HYPH|nr:hypothetical protein [Brucella pituitosa]MBO1040681.1 hypothetical protein [Brucella pituitosa]